MLLTVVAGAALAGWVVVRLSSPTPEPPEPRVAAGNPPAVQHALVEEPEPERIAPSRPEEPVEGDEADHEAIVRDLGVLVRAVRKDKHAPEVAFPDSIKILEFPRMIHYVRAVEFWQSAFPDTEGDR